MDNFIENTFEKGMHQDNEMVTQPKGTFRRGVNGRITSRKDGSFAWESIKGNAFNIQITQYKLSYNAGNGSWTVTDNETEFVPVGQIDGKDKIFLFFVHSDGSLLIAYVVKEAEDLYNNIHYLYYYKHGGMNNTVFDKTDYYFSQSKPITGYSVFENNEIERIYFTNTEVPPLTLNIAPLLNNKATTYVDEILSVDPDDFPWIPEDQLANYYLILSGAFYYNGVTYSPGEILSVSRANYNDIIPYDPGYDVIVDFYPLQNAEFDPLLEFPTLEFTQAEDGNLPCGNYIFAVDYYTRCNHYTNWSLPTGNIGVGKSFTELDPTIKIKSVLDWQRYRCGDFGAISSKGLKITLKNTETIFHKIRIVAFLINSTGNITSGKVIAEKEIGKVHIGGTVSNTATVDVTIDFINYAGADISFSEVVVNTARILNAQDINSMFRYGIVAGFNEEAELSIKAKITGHVHTLVQEIPGDVVDRLEETLSEEILDNYPLWGLYALDENGYVKKILSPTTDNSYGHLLPNQYYKVFEQPVKYPAFSNTPTDHYFPGDVFRCKTTSSTNYQNYSSYYGESNPGFVKPVFPVHKYTKYNQQYVWEWITLDEQAGLKMTGNNLAGYWGNETYRIGILPISKSGRPMYVRWIADWETPDRTSVNGTAIVYDAILGTHTNTNTKMIREYGLGSQKKPCGKYTSLRYMYPLVSVDLTEIIDDISGFYIVRAPRDKKILSEGFVEPIVKQLLQINTELEQETYELKYIRPPGFNSGSGGHHGGGVVSQSSLFDKTAYLYVTPEHLFNEEFSFDLNSVIKPVRLFTTGGDGLYPVKLEEGPLAGPPDDRGVNYEIFYRKFYNEYVLNFFGKTYDGEISIRKAIPVTEGESEVPCDFLPHMFWNILKSSLHGTTEATDEVFCTRGGKALLLMLSEARNWNELPTVNELWTNDDTVMVVQQQKRTTGLYTDSPESLANTNYMVVGHYQAITDEFKADIYSANTKKYEVQDIQLIGGDCHISLFDYTRSLVNGNNVVIGEDKPWFINYQRGDTVIIPLQTELYLAARNGRNAGYYKPSVIHENQGICYGIEVLNEEFTYTINAPPQTEFLETFRYNFSFQNKVGQNIFPGYPIVISLVRNFPNRIRYGVKKTYGELDDIFRKYPVAQFIDVNGIFGKLNNIRPSGQYLVYWQNNCVGYIPIQEKVMQSTPAGAYIQIGIGNAFEIYDEIGHTYGNQDKLSLMEVNDIFCWFDRTNRCIVVMDKGLKLTKDSKLIGIDSTLANMDLPVCTNTFPGEDGTVYSFYDYFKKVMYMIFYIGKDPLMIGIDMEKGIINGEFIFPTYPTLGFSSGKQLRTIVANRIYGHNEISATLYGSTFESFVEIVIAQGFDKFLKFVNMICTGNENFFTKVKYSANQQFDTGLYLNEVEEDVDSRNYKRFLDDMRFSIPQGSNGRMEGKSLLIRFTNEDPSNTVKLLRTSTKVILIT